MFGSSFPVRIVTSLTVIALVVLTATIANAQTPASAVDKPVAALSAAPPPANAASETKPAVPAANTPAVKNAPAAATNAPAVKNAPAAPLQQCYRTVKADVVAIPKAIMLNRLGATIPNRSEEHR